MLLQINYCKVNTSPKHIYVCKMHLSASSFVISECTPLHCKSIKLSIQSKRYITLLPTIVFLGDLSSSFSITADNLFL